MIKNFWILLVVICLQGCTSDIQLVVDDQVLPPTQPIELNVDSIQVINDAEVKYMFSFNSEHPLSKQVQSQFHKSVINFIEHLIIPNHKSSNVAVIRIDEASITMPELGRYDPLLYMMYMAVNHKESYISTIKGVVEIENTSGQVLQDMGFEVKNVFKDEQHLGIKRASEKALQALEQEITDKTHRYLYEYVPEK